MSIMIRFPEVRVCDSQNTCHKTFQNSCQNTDPKILCQAQVRWESREQVVLVKPLPR